MHGHNKTDPPIYKLSVDLWYDILDLLPIKDKLAITRSCRWLYAVVNPKLYIDNIREQDSTCLFWAAERGLLGTLQRALESCGQELDLNKDWIRKLHQSGDGKTDPKFEPCSPALHMAIRHRHVDIVQWLLDNGADVNAYQHSQVCAAKWLRGPKIRGTTRNVVYAQQIPQPCKRACCHDTCYHTQNVRYYLPTVSSSAVQSRNAKKGSEVYSYFAWWTALHAVLCDAISYKGPNELCKAMASILISHGASPFLDANPDPARNTGQVAIHLLAYLRWPDLISKMMAKSDLNINHRDADGNTALHFAAMEFGCHHNHCNGEHSNILIATLLSYGADINARNKCGETPLRIAAMAENPCAVPCLLQNLADPNALDDNGQSLLSSLKVKGRFSRPWSATVTIDRYKLLLEHGARIDGDYTWGWLLDKKQDIKVVRHVLRHSAVDRNVSLERIERTVKGILAHQPSTRPRHRKGIILRLLLDLVLRWGGKISETTVKTLVEIVVTSTKQEEWIVNSDRIDTINMLLEFADVSEDTEREMWKVIFPLLDKRRSKGDRW
jgi:ankyrin repeat protein